jgi:hypothetical protein
VRADPDARRSRSRWLAAALLLSVLAVLSLGGILWDALVDRAYWSLLTLPFVAAFWYWLIVGSIRRASE